MGKKGKSGEEGEEGGRVGKKGERRGGQCFLCYRHRQPFVGEPT